MPIYEFFCSTCNSKFELLCSLSQSDKDASCPRCHNVARRILSTFSAFSHGDEGISSAIAGSSSCGACSAPSCASCGD